MVDIMSATSSEYPNENNDDFEDGELPEDGEIQDEEDQPIEDKDSRVRASPGSSARTASPNGKFSTKKSVRGYGDDTELPKDAWPKDDVESVEDKDYRFEDEGAGDCDYRQGPPSRRRRHSPTEDDYDSRAKRPFGGRPYRPPFRKPKWATEHQICKFFREGYCRDGDACAYSHQAEDSLRKPELCRFYAQGYCKRGLTCLALHGEWPCKSFHKGECSRDPCQFSHQPLTDYTRPLFERMLQEEELGPQARNGPPHFSQTLNRGAPRRTLLPQGPSGLNPPPAVVPQAPTIHAPIPQQPTSSGQLAPPSVVVPTLAHTQHQPQPFQTQAAHPVSFFNSPAHAASPQREMELLPAHVPQAPSDQFDIAQMLAQIAGGDDDDDDSPASPPQAPVNNEPTDIRTIPATSEVRWRLLPVEAPLPYLGADIKSTPLNDPRRERITASQFDAVSSLFASGEMPSDPRAAAVLRDPRRRQDDRRSVDDKPRVSSWMPNIA